MSTFASIIPPGDGTTGYRGWHAEEQEAGRNGVQEYIMATSEIEGIWGRRVRRGGLETYNGVPPLAERKQSDLNNGSISR